MKILGFIGKVFLIVIGILICLYLYFDSDYSEVRRLRGQIEQNLELQLSELPSLIDRENYGWVEDGGDKALLKLGSQDCIAISMKMTGSEKSHEKSAYFEMFNRNNIVPSYLKIRFISNAQGDSTNYALDENTCHLYRSYHYR